VAWLVRTSTLRSYVDEQKTLLTNYFYIYNRQGLSVSELKVRVQQKEEDIRRRKREAALLHTSEKSIPTAKPCTGQQFNVPRVKGRKDNSPIRALSSILNVPKLLSTHHTTSQVSALWTTYHVSRSGGTGRGYLCASITPDVYQKMAQVAKQYPYFVIPLPRPRNNRTEPLKDDESDTAYEFYFLQWAFHGVPPGTIAKDLFNPPTTKPVSGVAQDLENSTVLFTPLQEYKLRSSFATPYLVLTHYCDLASSHETVLMRGEITPSSGNAPEENSRYMLSQDDAQLLAVAVQKFYLWGQGGIDQGKEGERLLRTFHEKPEAFDWRDLLTHGIGMSN